MTSPEGALIDEGKSSSGEEKGSVNYNMIRAIWNHNISIFITKNTTKPVLPVIMAGNASVPGLKMMNSWRYKSSSSSKSAAGQVRD